MKKNIYDRFINEKIIIPFGRIIRGGILKYPRDQSMIGRKGQRQYLISWLLEPKKNGAFLITGNRGSGKTSFVNYCVSKYNINLYSRLVQNELHFKVFDYFLIIFLITFISLLLSLTISTLTLINPSIFIQFIIWPVLFLPFLIATQYSLLFFKTKRAIIELQKDQTKNNNDPKGLSKINPLIFILTIRFWMISVFSFLVMSYGVSKIFIGFIDTTFNRMLFFFDIQILFILGLVILNNIIHKNSKFKTIKPYFILLWVISLIFYAFTFCVPMLFDFVIHSLPTMISCFIVLIIKNHINFIEMTDIFMFLFIISIFFLFTYFEYKYFKKEFRENTISSSLEKNKARLVLSSQWSIPVLIIKHYIPTITISLNMGFMNLQHSNIIHAMLVDLKSQYREIFLGRNHFYNNILPIVVAFLSVLLWNIISGSFIYEAMKNKHSDRTFIEKGKSIGVINNNKKLLLKLFSNKLNSKIKKKKEEENNDQIEKNQNKITKIENKITSLRTLFENTPYQLIQQEGEHLNNMLKSEKLYSKRINLKLEKDNLEEVMFDSKNNQIIINILDIIGILALFIFFYSILYYRPLTRSRKNIVEIDNLLNKLSSKITKSNSVGNTIKQGFLEFNRNKSTSFETNPVDSRIVEIEMLDLLNKICQDKGSWFLSPGNIWTIPATSIIFIFDELDKLHNHGEDLQKTLEKDLQKNHSQHEAARTYQINKLLSDIKNFINTAPAKFIFVAGRDLHDQWLADTNSRENFLTSIFDSEIYIPSLLTDHSVANANIKSNIIKYVNVQYKKAEYQFCKKNRTEIIDRRKNQRKYYQLFYTDQKNLSKDFVGKFDHKGDIQSLCADLLVFNYIKFETENDVSPVNNIYKEKFILDFIRFLTYRSQGNPKQLERNLFSFARPNYLKNSFKKSDRFKAWENIDYFCANALHFGDHEVFRIQFIADLYQQIDNKVGNYILQTDDKMAMAIFYLSDFIMKFHDSSFSWRHLIRLDELAHIHRLPDLNNVFKRMVQHFSGIYLHRVLNGIFTYRFRSDVSKEINYLSKISNVENASFNFTLDESGELKNIFRRKIKDKNRASWDLTSGLGDLFELDGEYDDARHQYIGAIKILDKQYQLDHGSDTINALNETFLTSNTTKEKSPLRLNVKWVNERLSLMLLIGLTYEKEGRLTAALSHYRDTKSLAKLIFNIFLGVKTTKAKYSYECNILGNSFDNNKQHNRNEVLKHFNILYQPIFAEAWLVEKLMGGIDTSLAIVEKGVEKIRNALPFIGNIKDEYRTSSSKVPHSNFAILASSLHNKIGDLAFFKGGQELISQNNSNNDNSGYLHRAMFHYAIALHELRRFIYYRHTSSGMKYNPHDEINKATIPDSSRPDFINLTFASNLIDLGGACLAKVNLSKVLNFPTPSNYKKCNIFKTKKLLIGIVDSWASLSNSECNNKLETLKLIDNTGEEIMNFGMLQDWVGNWNVSSTKYDDSLLSFQSTNNAVQRLMAGIFLTWIGIKKMEKGGYLESATKEYIELSNLILNIVWWHTLTSKQFAPANSGLSNGSNCQKRRVEKNNLILIPFLIEFSISCIEESLSASLKNRTSIISPKRNSKAKGNNPEFNKIMPEIITATYSAQLLIKCNDDLNLNNSDYSLFKKIGIYTNNEDSNNFSKILNEHLNYNRYPMLNRLRGLSVLVYYCELKKCNYNIGDLASTIINYNDSYDAPFHYTYLELGICAYLAYKELKVKLDKVNESSDLNKSKQKTEQRTLIWFKNIAIKNLENSIGSHTMGKSYYENITKLYYLYDDFNDRRIHLNQAMQMLGTSFAEKLIKILNE